MLPPEYLLDCADEIIELYDAFQTSVIQDMARRIVSMGEVSSSTLWQMNMLQEAGGVFNDAIQQMAPLLAKSDAEVAALFKDAGATAIAYDNRVYQAAGLTPISLAQSPQMLQTLLAGMSKQNATLRNLTATTAVDAQQAFIRASSLAHMQVTGGAMSYTQAITRAVKGIADEGLYVLYPSGHRDKIDVAVRRNVLTGVNQTCAQITLMGMGQAGTGLVEVTAHAGARSGIGVADHVGWQGRLYSVDGADDRYPHFQDVTGYGQGAGLCGWNCRHNFYPFVEGVSERAYDDEYLTDLESRTVAYDGQEIPLYDATQMQREMERDIRATKRELLAAQSAANASYGDEAMQKAFKEEFGIESAKLSAQRTRLKDFEHQTGLISQAERTQVNKFGRSEAQSAVRANRKVADAR